MFISKTREILEFLFIIAIAIVTAMAIVIGFTKWNNAPEPNILVDCVDGAVLTSYWNCDVTGEYDYVPWFNFKKSKNFSSW